MTRHVAVLVAEEVVALPGEAPWPLSAPPGLYTDLGVGVSIRILGAMTHRRQPVRRAAAASSRLNRTVWPGCAVRHAGINVGKNLPTKLSTSNQHLHRHRSLSWLLNSARNSQLSRGEYWVIHSHRASAHRAIHKMPRVACHLWSTQPQPPHSIGRFAQWGSNAGGTQWTSDWRRRSHQRANGRKA